MISLPCDIPADLRARHANYVQDPARESFASPLDLKNSERIEAWRQRRAAFFNTEFNRVVRDREAPAGSLGKAVGGVLVGPIFSGLIRLIGPE